MSIQSDPSVSKPNNPTASSHPVDPPQEKYSFLRRYFELQSEGYRKETQSCSTYCKESVDLEACLQDCENFKSLCQWHRKN